MPKNLRKSCTSRTTNFLIWKKCVFPFSYCCTFFGILEYLNGNMNHNGNQISYYEVQQIGGNLKGY
jgi:hypothetical protein